MCAPPTAAYQATGSILRAVRYLAILAGSYCCHRHNSKGDLRNPVSSPNATIWAAQVRHPLSILASFVALPVVTLRGEASGQAPLKNRRLPCSEQGQFGKAMARLPSVLTAKRGRMCDGSWESLQCKWSAKNKRNTDTLPLILPVVPKYWHAQCITATARRRILQQVESREQLSYCLALPFHSVQFIECYSCHRHFCRKSEASMCFASFPYRVNSRLNCRHFSDAPFSSSSIIITISINTNII